MSGYYFNYYADSYASFAQKLPDKIEQVRGEVVDSLDKVLKSLAQMEATYDRFQSAKVEYEKILEKRANREVKKLQKQLAALEKENAELRARTGGAVEQKSLVDLNRAYTLAIFDNILFAIENWAVDESPAPDFTLCSQAILFPLVYEPVMRGDSDYFILSVPASAMEVVRRGREYVQHVRSTDERSLTECTDWDMRAKDVHEWWVNDALPLLYGARSDDWEETPPKSLSEMVTWRDMPASRALDFPLIYDGMELVRNHGDDIRENTGLPAFNKQTVKTRLTAHD